MVTLKTVVLDDDKCIGCITCMRRCPTEAIRIVNGKAKIQYDKCINCGECVRSCKGGAKRPVYDGFDLVRSYAYKIALPSPSLFGQFNNLNDPNYVIEGLKALGFDEVFEVGLAAELVTDCTKKLMAEGKLPRPVISTACPAVAELILMKFHELADHMLGCTRLRKLRRNWRNAAQSNAEFLPTISGFSLFLPVRPKYIPCTKRKLPTKNIFPAFYRRATYISDWWIR